MKKIIVALIAFFVSSSIWAGTQMSIQIVQNNPGQTKIWATSQYFEQAMLDYFFGQGKIVSNSPIFVDDGDSRARSSDLRYSLLENQKGGMDYLIRVDVFFRTTNSASSERPALSMIESVSWKVYDVLSGAEVGDGSMKTQKVAKGRDNELGIAELAEKVAYQAAKACK